MQLLAESGLFSFNRMSQKLQFPPYYKKQDNAQSLSSTPFPLKYITPTPQLSLTESSVKLFV